MDQHAIMDPMNMWIFVWVWYVFFEKMLKSSNREFLVVTWKYQCKASVNFSIFTNLNSVVVLKYIFIPNVLFYWFLSFNVALSLCFHLEIYR